MKELTTEEKAKAYDKAIKKAKSKIKNNKDHVLYEEDITDIFPALKESEDEKIRKALIDGFTVMKESKNCGKTFSNHNIPVADILAWLEKQGEKESSNKIEPKFHEGNWIVYEENIYQIHNISLKKYYECLRTDGTVHTFDFEYIDSKSHLWTIQDAKEGDVLSDGTTIFIFKDLLSDDLVMSYCDYYTDGGESDVFCPLSMNLTCSKITPATKEQRDTLMKEMADAGYTFDFENKELKKIEEPRNFKNQVRSITDLVKDYIIQKPAEWSEEDEVKINRIVACLENLNFADNDVLLKDVDWLKSLKDRVQPKNEWKQENTDYLTDFENAMMHIGGSFFGQYAGLDPNDTNEIKKQANLLLELVPKQEWSKEDDKKLIEIINIVQNVSSYDNQLDGYINWLKSLRPQNRRKPSDEQIMCLQDAINDYHRRGYKAETLETLLKQLKQL